jgi:PucR family transcriptional regulator, purine catabolism regulatory protein
MSLTVRQLTEVTSLRTRFLAGRSGGDRPVLWAHSTELPDPWNWLGTGDLLLSNGYNFPLDPEGQVQFVRELSRANLAGIVFGERPQAPPVTPAALEAADSLNFPVLASEYSVPWVLLVRMVADSNSERASARLAKLMRQYDILRRTFETRSAGDQLLVQLGAECGCTLRVIDTRSGAAVLPPPQPLQKGSRTEVLDWLNRRDGPLPAFSRIAVEGDSTLLMPMAANDGAVLLATPTDPQSDVDLVVLQHAATIVGLEVERRAAVASRRRESGARLLQQLLTQSIDAEAASAGLKNFRLDCKPWRLLCWGEESQLTIEDMQAKLSAAKVPHLVGHSGSESMALVPAAATETDLPGVTSNTDARIGASLPVHRLSRLADAAREARWALEAARAAAEPVTVYGVSGPLFLPRSIAEGEAAVSRLLGPVLDYDRANDTQLMRSLVAYFDADRSYPEAAEQLGVHRQTLIYRIRRIEELTGRRVQSLTDQTELYLAVQTWKMLQAR